MGDSSDLNRKLDDMSVIELTGKIMVVAIVVLFLVVVFVFFLHIYAKWFWYRRQQDAANGLPARRRRRLFDFAPGHVESSATATLRRGLDPSVLKSIPILQFNPKSFKDGLECAVCLSDVSEGEKARLLPKCNHGFHVECIDMWFQSHSTCPLCRNPVSSQNIKTPESSSLETTEESSSVNGYSTESPNFPTNVLFWGNQNQVSTLGSNLEDCHQCPASSQLPSSSSSLLSSTTVGNSDGMLVIDIPRQMNEEEEPKSPAMTRLRSLKRLLSRDRRVLPCSPSNVDVEQVS